MVRFRRRSEPDLTASEALTRVVQEFDPGVRRALYAAANRGSLRRGTWNGCALNRAGAELGAKVSNTYDATTALGIPSERVKDFLTIWDRMRGSDAFCTAVLRDAILRVGLYDPDPVEQDQSGPAEPSEHVDGQEPVAIRS
jgi:hypothetical protein